MTLGVAVLCEHGECIVLASEQRATYGNAPVAPNDMCFKQYDLKPLKCFVSIAGRNSECHAVFSQFAWKLRKFVKRKVFPPELFMKVLDEARARELRRIYDWELRRRMGISLSEWARGKVPKGKMDKLVVKAGLSFMELVPFRVQLIAAGFIGDHTMFFRADRKERIEEGTSEFVIGSGQIKALNVLNRRGQNVHMSLARSLLHVYEAMHAAQSQTVGSPPEYVIIIKKRDKRVAQYPLRRLEPWRKLYESRATTASLDDSSTARMEVFSRLEVMIRSSHDLFSY